jgi:hypothetical protein
MGSACLRIWQEWGVGDFIDKVRAGRILGPLRRGFDPAAWAASYAEFGSDDADAALHHAGVELHSKARAIRAQVEESSASHLRLCTRLRALVAIANHNCHAIRRQSDSADESDDDALAVHRLVAKKLEIPGGQRFTADELLQTTVDALQIPLREELSRRESLSGNPEFHKVEWNRIGDIFNLAIVYGLVEAIWDDCLWNGYSIAGNGNEVTIQTAMPSHQASRAVSEFRHTYLALQFMSIGAAATKSPSMKLLIEDSVPHVTSIFRDGKQERLRFANVEGGIEDRLFSFVLQQYASEPYYAELLSESISRLAGARFHNLVTAWHIVSGVARVMLEAIELPSSSEDGREGSWLPRFCPTVTTDALTTAFMQKCSISLKQSRSLLAFLTFTGEPGQEIWAQPLIPVGSGTVAPVFAAALTPNLNRLVDVWMRQLGLDLGARGPAFEAYVRNRVKGMIDRSEILKNESGVSPKSLTIAAGDSFEELDLVFNVGGLVFVGEAKCALQPTECKQWAMHRKTVAGAGTQVLRKVKFLECHRQAFVAKCSEVGLSVSDECKICPLVIVNSPTHVGEPIEGVAVVDLDILSVFFSGKWTEWAEVSPEGEVTPIHESVLFSSLAEAEYLAPEYFRNPPQVDVLRRSTSERVIKIPAISPEDWEGDYIVHECDGSGLSEQLDSIAESR